MTLSEEIVNNHFGTDPSSSNEVSWKEISDIIRAKELREKILETQQYRYQNISMFDPEYELLVEDYLDYLEDLDEQGV